MKQQKKNGAVLIVVLLILASAAFLILESGKFLRIDYSSAAYQRVVVAGGSLLRSGLTVATEILLEDVKNNGDNADHRFDEWAQINEFFESISSSLESGDISGSVTAEDGRIPLQYFGKENDLSKDLGKIFIRLVAGLCAAHSIEADPKKYLDSIKIWLGKKDTQGDKAWYAAQDPAYTPVKKGVFYSPNELLLVRWQGVDLEDRRKVFYGEDGIPGLVEFITIWGNGKINVNTARKEIIAALAPDSALRDDFVSAIESYRSQGGNDFAIRWYEDVAVGVGFDMTKFPQMALDVKSTVFRVSLTAMIGAGHLNSTTILMRDSRRCIVLFENIH